MRLVIEESRDAERAVAPAQTRPVTHSGVSLRSLHARHAVLRNAPGRLDVIMEEIENGSAGHGLLETVQIIGAGDADIPCAQVARVEIIAGVPVNALHPEKAGSDRAAVT